MAYLLSSFSVQMVEDFPCGIYIDKVNELPNETLTPAITNDAIAKLLGVEVSPISVKLHKGDIAYVVKVNGSCLSDEPTTIPTGCDIQYVKVEIK